MSLLQTIININANIIRVLVTLVMFVLVLACGKTKHDVVNLSFDPETMPTMVTENVITLISDSGTTRYKLKADVWQVFDKAREPFWFFPEGIYLERFTDDFSVEATVRADTAWNYTSMKLWKLKGNVFVQNMNGDRFSSEELYWDQMQQIVYSDEYIEIKTGQTELKGYGFESNQEMTDYIIFHPHDGKIPYNDDEIIDDDEENLNDELDEQTR